MNVDNLFRIINRFRKCFLRFLDLFLYFRILGFQFIDLLLNLGKGLLNALEVNGKNIGDVKVVVNGAGSAGVAITKLLLRYGFTNVIMCDKVGIVSKDTEGLNWMQQKMMDVTNPNNETGSLADALKGADIFVGVSAPNIVTEEMVASMNKDAILFAMANPVPEIMPDVAKKAGAKVSGPIPMPTKRRVYCVLRSPHVDKNSIISVAVEKFLVLSPHLADIILSPTLSPALYAGELPMTISSSTSSS
mgnify:CR=1 FL=1